ncbi:hypothetical protein CAEBREN_09325 [Caenorhabditis brenneri]|uniref:Uncharacterized protein n=1 Tax=Caenorhabditis brenneri TaxID=135651 RepID=G0MP51_CAEBE|nr:hypothetical protein CAEBREN_09325 [Caenorhabditis brenneri]
MLIKWICSASVQLWARVFWFVVFQNGFLLLGIVLTVAGCSRKICCRKKNKTDPKSKKTGRTRTTSGSTTSGTTTGTRTSIPNNEISAAAGVFGSEQPETKITTTTTEGDTKTAEVGQEKNGKGAGGGGKSKAKKKKKKTTEDADEGNKKTAEVEEKKAETQDFNHENTLRIEMVDDDHTKTRTVDASACMDAYDTNAPNPDDNQGKLEKKESKHGRKNKSAKQKGKGKKKKDTTVQSVDCTAAAEDKEKEKVTNSKKSKKSRKSKKSKRSLRGPQPNSLNNDKAQQKSGPEDKKMQTMIEEEAPQKEKKDASIMK